MKKSKLRIGSAIFGSLTKVGGYQVFTINLLTGLAKRGHDVTLFVPSDDLFRNKDFYNDLNFKVTSFPGPSDRLARFLPFVLKLFVRFQQLINRFDIWQIVGSYPAAYIVSTLSGTVPLVLRAHGDDIQKHEGLKYGLRLERSKEQLITKAVLKMDKLIALNTTISEAFLELGVPPSLIAEVPNGVDINRFRKPSDVQYTRQEWNVPPGKTLLLTVGRFHEKKGYKLIPKIARELRSQGAQIHWIVVGTDTQLIDEMINQEEVVELVKTYSAIGFSDLTPAKSVFEVPNETLVRLYQAADIFVFPTLLEGFPRVLIEAMSAGLPVVTTDAPGCRELMVHKQNGMVGPAGEVEPMVSNIAELLRDVSLRNLIVGNGLSLAQEYDWQHILDKYESVYSSLIDSK